MMRHPVTNRIGFTVVELMIVIVVVAIIASITVVSYVGMQERAARTALLKTLTQASEMVEVAVVQQRTLPAVLPASVSSPDEITLTYSTDSFIEYSNLTPVQNGVLFHEVCSQLAADPAYSTIHSKDGNNTSSVVTDCDASVSDTSLMINGWDSKTWNTPLSKETLQTYIDAVPMDSWWTDRQAVVRGFYTTLIDRYSRSGGVWPITSFWDPWATPTNDGVEKEPLPSSSSAATKNVYCVAGVHAKYPDMKYVITSESKKPREGVCS